MIMDTWDPQPDRTSRPLFRLTWLGVVALALIGLTCCGGFVWLATFVDARIGELLRMP
jgi:hypothetical protein